MSRRRTSAVIAAAAAAGIVGVAGTAVAAGTSGAAAAPAAAPPAAAPPPAVGSTPAETAALGIDAATNALTQASTAQPADGTRARKQLHRVLHGELVLTDGGGSAVRTVDVQRGTVTAVSASSVTVHSTDGYTQSYVITSQTQVRTGHGADSRITDIKTGDKAAVVAVLDGNQQIAKRLLSRPPG